MAKATGPTPWQRRIRGVLVAGYFGFIVLGLVADVQPRLFWTVLLPLLPISFVLFGFANWRQTCPLAWFGELGRKLNRGNQRRVPKWLERWFFVVTFAVLLVMLVFRLVATNGDGRWLSGLLIGAALLALVTNWIYTGKTWCNFFCPLALVERVYTEPNSLHRTGNSQCIRCTACKSSCPDIDQENAYWRDLSGTARRVAIYAFPGLVLAFYTYYWLRYGDWEAYFDGRWTRLSASVDLVLGPGIFFAPSIPAVIAATLTLVGFSAASYALFVAIEIVVRRLVEDQERRRHVVLAVAAFAAFSIFYFFAGAPTLRRIPGATRALAFAAPLLATLFVVKRWNRTHQTFIREKGAAALLRNWPFDEPPPDDPAEVWARAKAGERAREQQLAAYANTIRGIIADGLVRGDQLRLLEGIREQLGISEREHDKVLARLTEEERDLFDEDRVAGVERRAQLEGYETALAEALLRHAPTTEIAELRRAFGVGREEHDALLEKMRGESGPLMARARCQLRRASRLHDDLVTVGDPGDSDARDFLAYVLRKARDDSIDHVLEYLEIADSEGRVAALRPKLFGEDPQARQSAILQLLDACAGAEDLVRELEPLIVGRGPEAKSGVDEFSALLERRVRSADPYLRAAMVWAAGATDTDAARTVIAAGRGDADPLVRETATVAGGGSRAKRLRERGFAGMATIERMQFLRRVPLFAELDPEDLHDLCSLAAEETVSPSGVLCRQGDVDAGDLFIVISGRASVVLEGREGEREVALLGPGEVIGELSLLDGSPRSATVRPEDGPLRVLRITGQGFRTRLLHRSRVAQPLLVTLAQRIRNVSRRAARS